MPGEDLQWRTSEVKLSSSFICLPEVSMRALPAFPLLLASMLLITSCSSAPPAPKAPVFVTFGADQSGRMGAAGEGVGQVTDKLAAIPQEAYNGTDVSLVDTVVNKGAASKGIRVMLKGPAFSEGLLGDPTAVSATALDAEGTAQGSKVEIAVAPDGSGGFIGSLPDFPFTKQLNITVVAPAKKGGTGEAQLYVYPLDKAGSSSAGFSHLLTVRSDSDGSNPAE